MVELTWVLLPCDCSQVKLAGWSHTVLDISLWKWACMEYWWSLIDMVGGSFANKGHSTANSCLKGQLQSIPWLSPKHSHPINTQPFYTVLKFSVKIPFFNVFSKEWNLSRGFEPEKLLLQKKSFHCPNSSQKEGDITWQSSHVLTFYPYLGKKNVCLHSLS